MVLCQARCAFVALMGLFLLFGCVDDVAGWDNDNNGDASSVLGPDAGLTMIECGPRPLGCESCLRTICEEGGRTLSFDVPARCNWETGEWVCPSVDECINESPCPLPDQGINTSDGGAEPDMGVDNTCPQDIIEELNPENYPQIHEDSGKPMGVEYRMSTSPVGQLQGFTLHDAVTRVDGILVGLESVLTSYYQDEGEGTVLLSYNDLPPVDIDYINEGSIRPIDLVPFGPDQALAVHSVGAGWGDDEIRWTLIERTTGEVVSEGTETRQSYNGFISGVAGSETVRVAHLAIIDEVLAEDNLVDDHLVVRQIQHDGFGVDSRQIVNINIHEHPAFRIPGGGVPNVNTYESLGIARHGHDSTVYVGLSLYYYSLRMSAYIVVKIEEGEEPEQVMVMELVDGWNRTFLRYSSLEDGPVVFVEQVTCTIPLNEQGGCDVQERDYHFFWRSSEGGSVLLAQLEDLLTFRRVLDVQMPEGNPLWVWAEDLGVPQGKGVVLAYVNRQLNRGDSYFEQVIGITGTDVPDVCEYHAYGRSWWNWPRATLHVDGGDAYLTAQATFNDSITDGGFVPAISFLRGFHFRMGEDGPRLVP